MPPAVVLGVSLALTAASTAMTVHSQRKQAKAAEQAADFNAKVSENEAIREELESREERKRTRIAGKRALAKQQVKISSSGVTHEGSPLLSMAETATNIELSVADQARASNMRAEGLRGNANMERFEGASKAAAHRTKAGASLLSGASRATSSIGSFNS